MKFHSLSKIIQPSVELESLAFVTKGLERQVCFNTTLFSKSEWEELVSKLSDL